MRYFQFIRVSAVVLAAVLALSAREASALPIVSIDAPGAVIVGELFTVDVDITDAVDLYAFQLKVTFDPLRLSAVDVQEGALLSSVDSTIFFPGFIDNVAGTITFVADTLTGLVGASGSGTLFSVQFTALGPGSGVIATAADDADGDGLFDSTLAPIADARLVSEDAVAIRDGHVPEPGTLALVAIGALEAVRRSRARRRMRGRP